MVYRLNFDDFEDSESLATSKKFRDFHKSYLEEPIEEKKKLLERIEKLIEKP